MNHWIIAAAVCYRAVIGSLPHLPGCCAPPGNFSSLRKGIDPARGFSDVADPEHARRRATLSGDLGDHVVEAGPPLVPVGGQVVARGGGAAVEGVHGTEELVAVGVPVLGPGEELGARGGSTVAGGSWGQEARRPPDPQGRAGGSSLRGHRQHGLAHRRLLV